MIHPLTAWRLLCCFGMLAGVAIVCIFAFAAGGTPLAQRAFDALMDDV